MTENPEKLETLREALDSATELCHSAARKNGWWQGREDIVDACIASHPALGRSANSMIQIAALGLIGSEVGEAIEWVRGGDSPDDKLPQFKGVDVELVDVIIRALDLLGKREAPVGRIFVEKLKKNAARGHMHGGKHA